MTILYRTLMRSSFKKLDFKASKAKSYKEIATILKLGDKVRIVVPVLKIKKNGLPTYSKEIYTVSKVIRGNAKNFTIPRYKLTSRFRRMLSQ